jgi:uncharacterized delta-60 repeat protein
MKKIFITTLLFTVANIFSQQAGDLDLNFGNVGFFTTENNSDIDNANCLYISESDEIFVAGGNDNFSMIKLMADGTFDTTFGNQGQVIIPFDGFRAEVNEIIVRPDGKIILAGNVYISGGEYNFGIVLLNPDGSLDTSFNETGKVVFDFDENINYLYAAALQNDGKIVVAGQCGTSANADFAVARINPDGTFDTEFGVEGKQRINIQGDDRGRCVAIQNDGKIVLGGYSYPVGSNNCWFAAVRLTTIGQLDNTYSSDGKVVTKVASSYGNDTVQDMIIQPDDKIVMVADSYIGSSQDIGVVRFTTDGELDTTFNGDGKFNTSMIGTTDYPRAITLQTDGKILISGSFYTTPQRNLALLRLTSIGEFDTTFSQDGKANYVVPGNNGVSVGQMKMQSTGQILICGSIFNNYMLARIFSGTELSINEHEVKQSFFYPNPASQIIYFSENVISVNVFTLEGKKIMENKNFPTQMDISNFSKGIYILTIQTIYGKNINEKLVIE